MTYGILPQKENERWIHLNERTGFLARRYSLIAGDAPKADETLARLHNPASYKPV
ncbi:MAG: hypothetical protein OXT69_13950 [Candidatus Poribacteria bacterium]|nr:hypothetical protein [Candidatus Poribacteria bacterium]